MQGSQEKVSTGGLLPSVKTNIAACYSLKILNRALIIHVGFFYITMFVLFRYHSDHIEYALDCLSDRSMFVANSARSLITKFLIKVCDWMVDQTVETTHGIVEIDDKCAIIVQRLRSMLNPEASTPTTSMMAVIEVTRMLLCESSMSGQKVLQDTKLFPECLNLMKTGDATVCQKLVDVICEMAKNR